MILEGWVGDGSHFEGPPTSPTIYHSFKAAIVVGVGAATSPAHCSDAMRTMSVTLASSLMAQIVCPKTTGANESTHHMRWQKYWSSTFSIIPSKEHPGLISFRMDWLDPFMLFAPPPAFFSAPCLGQLIERESTLVLSLATELVRVSCSHFS